MAYPVTLFARVPKRIRVEFSLCVNYVWIFNF